MREYKPSILEIGQYRFRLTPALVGEAEEPVKHYEYRIRLKRLDVPSDEVEFTFHNSHTVWREGRKRLVPEEKTFAFKCFIEDALAYLTSEDIDDFAANYGYDSIKELLATYEACKKTYFDLREKLKLTNDDLYELSERLNELEGEDKLATIVKSPMEGEI